ncbi:formate/nitrite transporter family protein [Selenihalanaerobacter shriftii]|uniref:Nitrite transporter NirC n=1 Tax=Selenihalanaerobacter shriftii TaxID=142842 RepID=A0A1T4LPS9_9FIRM|nr:formate/nitrite transporter family protein [Selenihalanaerobacter shriftii]SJZ56730.1 nitrite transporter NirC [Selenihalanaerobacter shriftii]
MFTKTTNKVAMAAKKKVDFMNNQLMKYFILSAFAGAFVGLGIMLIFSVGAPLVAINSPFVKLIMGSSFGVALTLVIFAGSELFTGNNLVMTIGWLSGEVKFKDVLKLWFWCYLGNLAGSIVIALLIFKTGLIAEGTATGAFIVKASASKMNAPIYELFFRGILCNMLVCLAVWMSIKVKNEVSKLILIFWCLLAFIGSGFEHSIANMSLLAMGLLTPHSEAITVMGYIRNLIPVTLGNMIGGGLLIGALYWYVSNNPLSASQKANRNIKKAA